MRVIKNGRYDVAIDLRGDARHILAIFLAGVKRRISYGITGAGFLLTHEVPYEGIKHETERNVDLLSVLGIRNVHLSGVKLSFSGRNKDNTEGLLRKSGLSGPFVVIHPIPGHVGKKWDNRAFAGVIRFLKREKGLLSVLVGSAADIDEIKEIISLAEVEAVNMAGKTTIGTLGGVISGALLFVGVDSGPAHIAAALGVPAIILFSGVNDPRKWAPRGKKV